MRHTLTVLLAAAALALCADALTAQGQWTSRDIPRAPSPRLEHAMAQASGNTIVLYGGAPDKSSGYRAGTFSWDGNAWSEVNTGPTAPPVRGAHAMVWDDNRRITVLFGGWSGNTYYNDTWEYKNRAWQQVATANSPAGRDFIDMAYDPATQTVLLFGGHDWSKVPVDSYNDTWSFDGNNWTQLFPSTNPPHRHGHTMAGDRARGNVVMFGGTGPTGAKNDTWVWDGTDWTNPGPATTPPARIWGGMAWDPITQTVLMFGGNDGAGGVLDDMWSWDGSDWTQLTSGPQALSWCPMDYDVVRQEMLIQGGSIDAAGSGSDNTSHFFGAAWNDLGLGLGGANGVPVLRGQGGLSGGAPIAFDISSGAASTGFFLVVGLQDMSVPFAGGTLIPTPDFFFKGKLDASGAWNLATSFPAGAPPGVPLYFQAWILDQSALFGFSSTNGLEAFTR